jgi:hypothetical protein
MFSGADSSISLGTFIAYGVLIFLYLVILKLLLNLLQQMGARQSQRSVVDRDIRRTWNRRDESSMYAFDIYGASLVIAKGGIATIAMAAIIVLLVLKFGLLATGVLIVMVVVALYGVDHWLRSREKPDSVRAEIRRALRGAGSMGTIILLSILLVVLLFVMTVISV